MTERFCHRVYLLLETKDTFVSVHFFYSPARLAVCCGPPNWVPRKSYLTLHISPALGEEVCEYWVEAFFPHFQTHFFNFFWYSQQTAKAPRCTHRESRHNGTKGTRIYDLCLNNVTYCLSLQIDRCVCVCRCPAQRDERFSTRHLTIPGRRPEWQYQKPKDVPSCQRAPRQPVLGGV